MTQDMWGLATVLTVLLRALARCHRRPCPGIRSRAPGRTGHGPRVGDGRGDERGITGGSIAAISAEPLVGREVVDISGHVVAPGFIDLHAHGQDVFSRDLQVRDGVTTALELESGTWPVAEWYGEA